MNIPTVVIGIAALLFGIYTMYVRSTNPDKFGKLKAMQAHFGKKGGALLHLVIYSIIPVIFGVIMLFVGFKGVSFF
jgi:hypothetical protein